jgi:hypothetical protein
LLSNLNPGNGGPLLQPKGQRGVFYQVHRQQPPEITPNEPSSSVEEPEKENKAN